MRGGRYADQQCLVVADTWCRHRGAAAGGRAARVGTMPLTADDHVQIQQLVTRFGYALDTGANDGAMFADLFTEDGVFGEAKGRAQLAALARTRRGGAAHRHFVTNVIVRPTERGATGTQYEVMFAVGQDGKPEHHRAHRAVRGHVHEDACRLADPEARVLSVDLDDGGRQGGSAAGAGRPAGRNRR